MQNEEHVAALPPSHHHNPTPKQGSGVAPLFTQALGREQQKKN